MEKNGNKQELQSARHSLINTLGRVLDQKMGKVRNEFRFNHKSGHPNYLFEESNGKVKSIGITHCPTFQGKSNMPLVKNPQRGKENEPAYIRNGIISDRKKSYGKVKSNFEFSDDDMPNVKSKIRNYKNRRRKNQKKK